MARPDASHGGSGERIPPAWGMGQHDGRVVLPHGGGPASPGAAYMRVMSDEREKVLIATAINPMSKAQTTAPSRMIRPVPR